MGKKKTPFSKKLKDDFIYGKGTFDSSDSSIKNDVEIIELKPDIQLSVSDIYGDFKGTKHSKGSLVTKGKNYIKDLI